MFLTVLLATVRRKTRLKKESAVSINSIRGKNHKSPNTSVKLNGIIINEPEVIASSFNSHFNSIPITMSNNIDTILMFGNYLNDKIPLTENYHHTSIPEITKITGKLNQGNSVAGIATQQLYLNPTSLHQCYLT